MKRQALHFLAPRQLELRDEVLPSSPPAGQVRVRTELSAISAGTEGLVWRGQMPANTSADASIAALSGDLRYPLKYGYACVGTVIETGPDVAEGWLGQRVFGFNPHESVFDAAPAGLQRVPDNVSWERAALLPNTETAVNFVHDGAPLLGERVCVLGAGVVGLLTVHLLAQFPLAALTVIEPNAARCARALQLGAHQALPSAREGDPHDLVFEVSGAPAALNAAITMAGYTARVLVGSWYGSKRAEIELGGHFHRNRIRLISSQVSSIDPQLSGRWDKARRFATAWRMLANVPVAHLITHRLPLSRAAEAYAMLEAGDDDVMQVLLTHAL